MGGRIRSKQIGPQARLFTWALSRASHQGERAQARRLVWATYDAGQVLGFGVEGVTRLQRTRILIMLHVRFFRCGE